jgi:hypothetical protein
MQQTVVFSRRKFLKTSTGMLVGSLAFSLGSVSTPAVGDTWKLSLESLDSDTGKALLKVARHIFPHDTLDDAVYALVVKDLDGAAADASVAGMLSEGVAQLNDDAGGNWLEASDEEQLKLLTARADGPMFGKVKGTAVVSLYNNEMAWEHFGYEGASFDKGGYINRGFQDLEWLPQPSESASPPKA